MRVINRIPILIVIVFGFISCTGGRHKVVFLKKTEIRSLAERPDFPGNKLVTYGEKGDTAVVLSKTYSKEFMFYEIKTKDGTVGYMLCDIEKMKELDK